MINSKTNEKYKYTPRVAEGIFPTAKLPETP
jgi:hypothetical protein